MKILYVSAFPIDYFNELENLKIKNLVYANQKFNSTFIHGFKDINCDIEVLCPSDIYLEKHQKGTRFGWKTLTENNIKYHFPPTSSNKYIRKLIRPIALTAFIKSFFKKNKDGIVLMDTLSPCSWTIHKASKNICHIVTDLTNDPVEHEKHKKMYTMISEGNYLVLLTEQMKSVIKMSDSQKTVTLQGVDNHKVPNLATQKKKVIIYTGTINERNGISNIMRAYKMLDTDYELHFYGTGVDVNNVIEESKKTPGIKYMGTVSEEEITKAQQEALIAVNPELLNHSFSTYSFPSKLLVYLVSGAATITTKLPCIPQNYYDVLETFESDSVESLYEGLKRLTQKSKDELIQIGKKQQDFVLKNCANTVQAQKIIDMVSKNLI